jgi:hypothetical protein
MITFRCGAGRHAGCIIDALCTEDIVSDFSRAASSSDQRDNEVKKAASFDTGLS